MVKVLEYGRQVCLGVALAMMLASLVALPHNRVLADEGGPGGGGGLRPAIRTVLAAV